MYTQKLINFINSSPSAFHTVDTLKKELLANGSIAKWEKEYNDLYATIEEE